MHTNYYVLRGHPVHRDTYIWSKCLFLFDNKQRLINWNGKNTCTWMRILVICIDFTFYSAHWCAIGFQSPTHTYARTCTIYNNIYMSMTNAQFSTLVSHNFYLIINGENCHCLWSELLKTCTIFTTIVAIIFFLFAQHQLHLQHIWLLFSEHCSLYSSAVCCRCCCCCCCSCCSYHFKYRTFIFFCIFDDFEWRQQYFSVDLIDFVCRVFVFVCT